MDEAYFLFETLSMLERFRDFVKDFELTVLVNPDSLLAIQDGLGPPIKGLTDNVSEVLSQHFDLSVNLSMNQVSSPIHAKVQSDRKLGAQEVDNQLLVPDVWSSYLLTLKARAPFLTFHMQDIYKNILGIKQTYQAKNKTKSYQSVVIGLCNTEFFPSSEQEKMINLINTHHPQMKIRDISEIDPVSDLSHVLYIGPANLPALTICESGATGIFLSEQFQGFNLLPYGEGHFLVSSKNSKLESSQLIKAIDSKIKNQDLPKNLPFAVYLIDEENLFGSFLRSLNESDDNYPIYQCHVVLWNYVLNLFDVHLEIISCSNGQVKLLKTQVEVAEKLSRLYDYAMSSIHVIHQEAKSFTSDNDKIQGHIKNLKEMEEITDKISQSHAFLRPLLDFYRIRRGQNDGKTLLEQAQHSFLTYSEEHQALKAILELFTVTLRKNEVSL
jgi:hypothetical protein